MTAMSSAPRSLRTSVTRGKQVAVGPGEAAQAYEVHILLHGRRGDLFRGLVAARVDHLEPGVPKTAGEDPGAPVMSVEARFWPP